VHSGLRTRPSDLASALPLLSRKPPRSYQQFLDKSRAPTTPSGPPGSFDLDPGLLPRGTAPNGLHLWKRVGRFSPSPLAGEGAERATRSAASEAGEGCAPELPTRSPLTRLARLPSAGFTRHPLPQGERAIPSTPPHRCNKLSAVSCVFGRSAAFTHTSPKRIEFSHHPLRSGRVAAERPESRHTAERM
jgi:hypothetical protein